LLSAQHPTRLLLQSGPDFTQLLSQFTQILKLFGQQAFANPGLLAETLSHLADGHSGLYERDRQHNQNKSTHQSLPSNGPQRAVFEASFK
jgi:hypothetical protein